MDCEVFTFDCLEAAHILTNTLPERTELEISSANFDILKKDKEQKDYDREHVTPWMQRTKELKKANVVQKDDMSHVNLCVDVPEDILRLEKLTLKVH